MKMKKIKPYVCYLLLMSGWAFTAQAQQDSARLYQKTEQFLADIKMPAGYADAINTSVEQQIAQQPALADHRETLKAFFEKWFSWPAVKTDVVKIYLKYYTEEEIDALIKFYATPAGKKMIAITPSLQKDMVTLQQSKLTAHVQEWNEFIADKVNGAGNH